MTTNKVPSYASKEFFKNVLEKGLKTKNIEIENFTMSSAGGGGENYTSDIYRVLIKFKAPQGKPKEISLIVKDIQTEGKSREILNKLNVLNNERSMYLEMVPEIEQLVGNNTMMVPKCFYISETDNVFVLQDLKALGYELADRLIGLDEKQCEVVLKKIGQFHAASMVIAKKNPESVQRFDKAMLNDYSKDSPLFKAVFTANFQHMVSIIETWPDYEAITKKLKKIELNFLDIGANLLKPQLGELKVLNHGDLWVNNFMLKYDNKNVPCDAVFIDLQVSVYGSPGIDINYFLNLSPQLNVLKTKRYELLKVYYHSLKSTLERLNYSPIPQWDDVRREIRAKEFFGLIVLSGILPVITLDRNTSIDNSIEAFENAELSKKKRDISFSSERMQETMKYALNRLDELGVLDL